MRCLRECVFACWDIPVIRFCTLMQRFRCGEGGAGYCNVYVSADSTWTVTGDSTVSSLENEGTIIDSEGKTVTIQGTDGTVYVQGDSGYTITTGSYSDTADLSGATAIQDQSAYTVEKPDQL